MESGTLSAIPAPKHHPKNHAPGPFGFIRDVGGKSRNLRRKNKPASSRYSQRCSQRCCDKQPTPHSISAAGSSSDEDSAAENELLQAANKSRELAGVPPLRMEESLREAARAHARRMVESERLEHRLPGEPSLVERIAQVSPLRMDRAGENIADASCAPGANDVLMRSAPHRENLLDRGFN